MRYLIVPLSIILIQVFCFSLQAQELIVMTENIPQASYNCKDGVCGFSVEIVKEIIRRLKLDIEIQIVPWKRGYHYLSTQPNIVLFQTAYTDERALKFQWCGPIAVTKYVLVKAKTSDLEIAHLDDAKRFEIGTYADDYRENLLLKAGFDQHNFTHVFGEDANIVNLKLLLTNRIDLWVTSLAMAYASFESFKARCHEDPSCNTIKSGNPEDFLEVAYIIQKIYLYIAFSKNTSLDIVQNWQKTLETMKSQGVYQKIMMTSDLGKTSMTLDTPL